MTEPRTEIAARHTVGRYNVCGCGRDADYCDTRAVLALQAEVRAEVERLREALEIIADDSEPANGTWSGIAVRRRNIARLALRALATGEPPEGREG